MTETAGRVRLRLPFWTRAVLALAAGAVGSFAQAPWDLAPLILVPFLVGFLLMGTQPFLTGWLIGVAYFAPTLGWITEPFQVDAELHGWLAPFAAAGMAAGLSLFWGAAFWIAARLGGRSALAMTWPLAELGRAYLFTGFPWAMAPQAMVDAVVGQALAWVGPHGLTLALCLVCWLIARGPGRRGGRAIWSAASIGAIAVLAIPAKPPAPDLTDSTVRIVQPNAPQDEKWNPEKVPLFVNRLMQGTAAAGAFDLVVWPETALPYLLEHATPVLRDAAIVARGAQLVLGLQRREDGRFFNSLVVLDPQGDPGQVYDKRHLVPFGEYMPFPALFRRIGIAGLAERVDGAFSAGEGRALLSLGELGRAQGLICYEAVFPNLAADGDPRPDMLIQITNDAWFGDFAGPQQHFAQARMRAIEQGLPVLRAANTGISAVIGPRGKVLGSLPLGEHGHLDAGLPEPLPPTLYARTGDWPWAFLLFAATGVLLLRRRSRLHWD